MVNKKGKILIGVVFILISIAAGSLILMPKSTAAEQECSGTFPGPITGCTGTGPTMDAAIQSCLDSCKSLCKNSLDGFCRGCKQISKCYCSDSPGEATCILSNDECVKYNADKTQVIGSIPGKTCTASGSVACSASCTGTPPPKKTEFDGK